MSNNENNRYIYLRSTRERIPCTQEEFDNYYRETDCYRVRQQRRGMCVCPPTKRLDCDTDCATCPYRKAGAFLSLNETIEDEDGNEVEWGNLIEDPSSNFDEDYVNIEQYQILLNRIIELLPNALEIVGLGLQGLSRRQIATRLGINNTTLDYRINKLKRQLEIDFPEYFEKN